ncbi:hypothetical protein BHE74_00025573 [Ensete ventricosum]|nr:hypothetical protein BHE74_00025573 [Ensete ventricosum]
MPRPKSEAAKGGVWGGRSATIVGCNPFFGRGRNCDDLSTSNSHGFHFPRSSRTISQPFIDGYGNGDIKRKGIKCGTSPAIKVIRTSGRKLGEKQPKTGPPSPIKNRGRSSYWSPEGVSDRPPPAPDHPGSSAVGYAFHPDLVESNM